jgi:hypothetical protein
MEMNLSVIFFLFKIPNWELFIPELFIKTIIGFLDGSKIGILVFLFD